MKRLFIILLCCTGLAGANRASAAKSSFDFAMPQPHFHALPIPQPTPPDPPQTTRTFIAEDNLYTVATLPAPASTLMNLVVIVTDAAVAGSCSTGGGTARAFCQNTGSAWLSLGGSGGGGTIGGGIGSQQVAFGASANVVSGDSQLTWDTSNKILKVGPDKSAFTSYSQLFLDNVSDGLYSFRGVNGSRESLVQAFEENPVSGPMQTPASFVQVLTNPAPNGSETEALYFSNISNGAGQNGVWIAGMAGNVINNNNSNVLEMRGIDFDEQNIGSGTVTRMSGVNPELGNFGSGVITSTWNYMARGAQNFGSGSIHTDIGLYLQPHTVGTVNNYDIYFDDEGATSTNWGIFQAGSNTKNLFPNVQLLNLQFNGSTSGSAAISVAAIAGTPNVLLLPTTTGTALQVLTTDGGNPQQLSWSSNVAAAWSGLSAGTNSNAGTFAASGNAWDYHSASHTRPVVSGLAGSAPAGCSTSELFFATDATAGQNLYMCNGGVWTQQLNSGASGASTSLGNLAAVAINTTLLPAAVNTVALGSNALSFTNLFLGTVANQTLSFDTSAVTANRVAKIPNAASTLMRDCPAVTNQFMTAEAQATGSCSQATVGVSAYSPNEYIAGAGAVNVMTATMSPAATALTAGLEVHVLPNLANTITTPTLNVNGLGAATIKKFGNAALASGDYSTTAIADFLYDGASWQLTNPQTLSTTATSASVTTFTNKTTDAEATGNSLSLPVKAFFGAAGCNNSTAGPSLDLGTTNAPTPACSGSTVRKGVLQFTRGNVAYINWHLPPDWNSSAATDIELGFTTTDTTNGHVTSFNIQTGCNKVDGTATDDPTLNALQALSVTTGASQISGGELTGKLTSMTMTGCTADYNFEIAITRNNSGTDTNTDTGVAVKFAEMTVGVTKNAANR